MGDLWWIAGLAVYVLVGGLLLLRLSARHRDFAPAPDWTGVALLLGWPLALACWLLLREPDPSANTGERPGPTAGRLPPAGRAVTDLSPQGTVELAGRRYTATAEGGPVGAGEAVEILGRAGRILRVRGSAAEPGGAPDRGGKK